MCCVNVMAQEITMATTQFMRPVVCKVCWPQSSEQNAQHPHPRMNWVVVTDDTGKHSLKMDWYAERGD